MTAHPATSDAGDCLRCACGSLLARLVEEGVELKCRRCKRTIVIPLIGAARTTRGPARAGP